MLEGLARSSHRDEHAACRSSVGTESMLLRAIAASGFGVTLADARRHDLPLVYANDAFQALAGYALEEIVGRNCRFLQGADTDPQALELIRSAISRRASTSCLLLNYRKDGKPFWNRFQISPLFDQRGDIEAFLGIQVDVSDDKRRIDIERERQKIEALGRLSGGMAHELNNALQPILLLAESLQDNPHIPSDDRASHLATIIDNAVYARDITSRVLNFSRRSPNQPTLHDAIGCVHDAITFARQALPATMQLNVQETPATSDPSLPGCVRWQIALPPSDLNQIFLNLFGNAADASNFDGQVDVSMSIHPNHASVCADNDGQIANSDLCGSLQLIIRDHGQGMDAETKKRACEPFFTTKEPGKGTGLGLSMVYGTITALGGSLTIESEPGDGTAFDLTLPVTRQHTQKVR